MLDEKPVTEFRSDKVRALLAYLALEAGQPHRRDALAGLLWPEATDRAARTNLRLSLHRLRQALGEAAEVLSVTAESVQFNLDRGHAVDVATFSAHLAAVDRHAPEHRHILACPGCVGLLRVAADLYRGELLQGFFVDDSVAFSEWLLIRREGLHRRALAAHFHLAEHHQRRGEGERAQHYAARQLALEPWREEAHRQLMRALALGGQRSAALAQYEACRQVLAQEFGVEPSAETATLHERIREADRVRGARPPLPPPYTPLVGRAEVTATILERLADPECRLLTLLGPGGIGKTRLALHAAEQLDRAFLHGAAFVPLGAVATAANLASTIARGLGLVFSGKDDAHTQLSRYLAEKEILVVLDSFEQLLPSGGADRLADLLAAAPGVKLLATSRERLSVREEWGLEIEGLACPKEGEGALTDSAAVQLFVESARRVQPHFALTTADAPAVTRICRATGGMPLGIELAAAWVRAVPVETIANEIDRNLDFLATTLRNVPERHRSLRAAFDHSWRRLSPEEQGVLRRLAVFRGGIALAAAEAVAGASLARLAGLFDKSLVRQVTGAERGPRYELHELIRHYAEEQLAPGEAADAARRAHLMYFVQLAETAETRLRGEERAAWLGRLEDEHDNLRAALHWSLTAGWQAAGLRLAASLAEFWRVRGYLDEGRQWLDTLLAKHPAASPSTARAKAERGAGSIAADQGRIDQAQAHLSASLELSRALDSPAGMAGALLDLAHVAWVRAEYAQAQAYSQASLDLYGELGDRYGMADATRRIGMVLRIQGQVEQAVQHYQDSLRLYRELKDQRGEAQSLESLGLVARQRNDLKQAEALHQASLTLRRALGDPHGLAYSLSNLGSVASQRSDWRAAQTYLDECLAMRRELGDRIGMAAALNSLGHVALSQAHTAEARSLFEASLDLHREIGDRYNAVDDLRALGKVAQLEGQEAQARGYFEQSLALAREVGTERRIAGPLRDLGDALYRGGDRQQGRAWVSESLRLCQKYDDARGQAECVEILASIAQTEGWPARAAQCLGFAQALRGQHGLVRSLYDQRAYENLAAAVRARLPEPAFSEAWAKGAAMRLEQIRDEAHG